MSCSAELIMKKSGPGAICKLFGCVSNFPYDDSNRLVKFQQCNGQNQIII